MKKLLVVGGEGNMSGMSADTAPDDLLGLIRALKDNPAHDFILFHFTDRFFMPPEDQEAIIPLFAEMGIVPKALIQIIGEEAFRKLIRKNLTDDDLLNEARKHRDVFHKKLLEKATHEALRLFYHAFLSFTGGRQVVLICGQGNKYSEALLRFFWSAEEDGMTGKRVHRQASMLINPIREWPVIFKRFTSETVKAGELLPGVDCKMEFPGKVLCEVDEALRFCDYALNCECKAHYPARDDLNNPRALMMESPSGGWLLAIPRPPNMSNFAKGLRTGKGFMKKQEQPDTEVPVTKPSKVERSWMTREEVAEMIKRSKDTVDDLRSDGTLVDAPKAGRQVRISKDSVQRYLDGKK